MNEDELDDSQTPKIDSWLACQENQDQKLSREVVMRLAHAIRMDIEELYERIEEYKDEIEARLGDLSVRISMIE